MKTSEIFALLSMNFRYMRLILFFDLPVETNSQKKAYRNFVKNIKRSGFYMLQESVYLKLVIDQRSADASIKNIKKFLPKEGNVAVLNITEKQFNSIDYLLGEHYSEVINDQEKYIEL